MTAMRRWDVRVAHASENDAVLLRCDIHGFSGGRRASHRF